MVWRSKGCVNGMPIEGTLFCNRDDRSIAALDALM